MRRFRPGSLVFRLYAFSLLLLLVVWAGLYARFRIFDAPWRGIMQRNAEYYAGEVASVADQPAALDKKLEQLRSILDAHVAVFDDKLQTVAGDPPSDVPPPDAQMVERLSRQDHVYVRGPPTFFSRFQTRSGVYRYLVVAMTPPPGTAQEDFIAIAAVLLVVAIISLFFSRGLARPLAQLASAARRLGSGELGARTGIRRRDELGEVAEAFDDMASQLERQVRAQKELLANVSHELRTPLARIRVALDIAEEGNAEATRESLKDITCDLSELEKIIEDVLAASKLEAQGGVPNLRKEKVNAQELIERSAQRFRSTHKQLLKVEASTPLPDITVDPTLFRRAIDNLLDNAGKYSDEKTEVTLAAERKNGSLEIAVRDRGIGIDEQDLPRLFTPFFRTDRSRARTTGGVGLGLALVKGIVEAHGGRIQVQSRVGEGTTVSVALPVG